MSPAQASAKKKRYSGPSSPGPTALSRPYTSTPPPTSRSQSFALELVAARFQLAAHTGQRFSAQSRAAMTSANSRSWMEETRAGASGCRDRLISVELGEHLCVHAEHRRVEPRLLVAPFRDRVPFELEGRVARGVQRRDEIHDESRVRLRVAAALDVVVDEPQPHVAERLFGGEPFQLGKMRHRRERIGSVHRAAGAADGGELRRERARRAQQSRPADRQRLDVGPAAERGRERIVRSAEFDSLSTMSRFRSDTPATKSPRAALP